MTQKSYIVGSYQIAHCVTGLGPSNNSALGGEYFIRSRIPFVAYSDSSETTVNQDQQLFIWEYSICFSLETSPMLQRVFTDVP